MEKNMKLSKVSALGLMPLAAISSSMAVAQESGAYIGASVGRSIANIDRQSIADSLLPAGIATTRIERDERDQGHKLFGGYQLNRNFALEGGYFDLGTFGFTASTLPAGTLRGRIKVQGVNLDLVGFIPFNERFAAFARFGLNYAEAKDSFAGTGSINVLDPRRSERDTNIKLGAGLQFNINESFALRAEIERYRINDAVGHDGDIDLISGGLIYRFGRTRPAPVAHTDWVPEPAPVHVVVPVLASTRQYCSILDFQFEVNQDEIQREEKEKLAVIGTFLNKYPESSAIIEGHTDNVGSPEANLELSARRANSVLAYLTDTLHVPRERVSAVGYGDTRPIGDNATEEGKRMNRRIGAVVACVTDIEGLTVAPARLTMALMIEFDGHKAAVRPEYRDELRRLAGFLKANPAVTATVEGHTGNLQATPELAMKISQQRAQNVVDYLVNEFGIARSRLSAEGFGRTRRFAYNTSLEGQQENRRVNVIINYPAIKPKQ